MKPGSAEFALFRTLRLLAIMSRLRRLVLSNRFFFISCRLARKRQMLCDGEFGQLAQVIHTRRKRHGFLLTAWVFLPDHWHAIFYPHSPLTISDVMEAIKVSSTRQINRARGESGPLWQGRFFDRALRTVKEYNETLVYIHWNPVKAGLVAQPEQWRWSSVHDFSVRKARPIVANNALVIDPVELPLDPQARI